MCTLKIPEINIYIRKNEFNKVTDWPISIQMSNFSAWKKGQWRKTHASKS